MLDKKDDFNKIKYIVDIVKDHTQIDPLKNVRRRLRPLVETRALLILLLRKYTDLSSTEIGNVFTEGDFKGKNHASILHALKKADIYLHPKFGDKRFMYNFTMCDKRVKEVMPIMDFEHETVAEELIRAKELNVHLIHREMHRKEQITGFLDSLRYLPDRYRNQIEKRLGEWRILS